MTTRCSPGLSTRAWWLFANVTLLNEAGVTKMPETWDEFYDACKMVVDNTDADELLVDPHGSLRPGRLYGQRGRLSRRPTPTTLKAR